MKMTKGGLVLGFTKNDLNHCFSDFFVYPKNWRSCGVYFRRADSELARAWLVGLLVAAFGGVAAVNVLRLGAGALGAVLWALAGAGAVCALVCGIVQSGRAAE